MDSKVDLSRSTAGGWHVGNMWRYRIWRYLGMHIYRCLIGHRLGPLRYALLRKFGARIGSKVLISAGARIDYPWLLEVDDNAWIGEQVWFYNTARVRVGAHAVISNGTTICTGSHEVHSETFDLYVLPINIGPGAWIAMQCFIHPGVSIGANSVVGARSVVTKDIPPNLVCTGNPCRAIKERFPSNSNENSGIDAPPT